MIDKRVSDLEATARLEIERRSLEAQTVLLAGGLQTDEAKQFLAEMPTAEQLMPSLDMAALNIVMPGLADGRLATSLSIALTGLNTIAALSDGLATNGITPGGDAAAAEAAT